MRTASSERKSEEGFHRLVRSPFVTGGSLELSFRSRFRNASNVFAVASPGYNSYTWLGLVAHTNLLFIRLPALCAFVETYLRSRLVEKRLRVWLHIAQFPSAFVAVWALVAFPVHTLIPL